MNSVIEWIAPPSPQTTKTLGWYIFMSLIVLFFVVYGLLSQDSYSWVISVTFLLMAGVYYFFESKPKGYLRLSISELGIFYASQFYAFNQIKSFWIINEPDHRALHFTTYKGALAELSILIPIEVDIAKVREYLKFQIPEEEGRRESFSDQLIRNLGL